MMGEFECDDGNTIDGDGCDKECKKEPNAICDTSSSTGSCYLPGYNIAYVEGMYKVNLKFNFPVDNIEQYLSNLKAGIRRADGSLADVKVSSAKVLNDSTIELELAMDEVETTAFDSLVVELPGYPKYSDGDSYLNMSKLSSAALPNVQTKESGITKGLL
jgi:cysteine-rich repeat protein